MRIMQEANNHPAAALASSSLESSQTVQQLLQSFQEKMRQMDDLEDRIDARACRIRRRVACVVDQHYAGRSVTSWPFRQSHVRMWASHEYEPEKAATGTNSGVAGAAKVTEETAPLAADTAAVVTPADPIATVSATAATASATVATPESFTFHLEGCLLIGHLDHASAAEFDRRTGYTAPQDDLDRSRGGEREDDRPVPAFRLTHLFDKLIVEFQTVYLPKSLPSEVASDPPDVTKKTTRRSALDSSPSINKKKKKVSKKKDGDQAADVDLRKCVLSDRQQLTWTPDMADDAHGWAMEYRVPPPPLPGFEVYSVVARLQLFPCQAGITENSPKSRADRYTIRHPRLQELFPRHGPPILMRDEQRQQQANIMAESLLSSSSKKRKIDEMSTTADGHQLPPVENEIQMQPSTLTMSEIVMALFTYVRDKKLMANQQSDGEMIIGNDDDKSTIICNELLRDVLGVERLPFSQLQATLLQNNAIARVIEPKPCKAIYVMRKETAMNYEKQLDSTIGAADDGGNNSNAWQWDMECSVPHLFAFRARELLRRVKRRELEYTSSRTKARYLLGSMMSSRSRSKQQEGEDGEFVRQQIESAITDKSLVPEVVWHALAKGAPPRTEARRAAQLDAQLSYLLRSQLPERCHAASKARELLGVCRDLGNTENP